MESTSGSDKSPKENSYNDSTTNSVAKDQRMYWEARKKMIEAEARMDMFKELRQKNLGTNETVLTVRNHMNKLKNRVRNPDEHTKALNEDKLKDATIESKKAKRKEREAEENLIKKHLENGISKNKSKWIIEKIRKDTRVIRKKAVKKYKLKIETLEKKQSEEKINTRVKKLPIEMEPYKNMSVFKIIPGSLDDIKKEVNLSDIKVPTLDMILDEDEERVLKNPPKHAMLDELSEEDFKTECEE